MSKAKTTSQKESIFRKTAMERLSSPEQLDKLLIVVSPKGWIGLLCILSLLAGVIIWMTVATLPVQISLKGIIRNPQGLFGVSTPSPGIVSTIDVKKGQSISKGQSIVHLSNAKIANEIQEKKQELALINQEIDQLSKSEKNDFTTLSSLKLKLISTNFSLQNLQNQEINLIIHSPIDAVVDRLETNLGNFVTPGSTIAILEQNLLPNERPQAYGYVPLEYRNRIVAGMEAQIELLTYDSNKRSTFKGKVVSISPFALSQSEILARFGHLHSLKYLANEDAPLLEVQVDPDPGATIASGDFCTIQIVMMRKRPIDYFFP